jgi:hypothetical protein
MRGGKIHIQKKIFITLDKQKNLYFWLTGQKVEMNSIYYLKPSLV